MKVKIVSVGRKNADPMTPMVDEYIKRIKRFTPFESVILKPAKDEKIAEKMLAETRTGGLLVAMDERGKLFDSVGFSKLINKWLNQGQGACTFVIGGADGLPATIKEKAQVTIGLSKMTLPHRMARLMLVEQIYRAFCIIKGVPYQK